MITDVSTSTALYAGTGLMVTTSITTVFLSKAGFFPIIAIFAAFLMICLFMSDNTTTIKGRRALAVSGLISALTCHVSLTWLLNQ